MNCPKCGNEMSFGWMVPGKICYLEWAPGHGQFPMPRKGRVLLKPTPPRDTPFDFAEYRLISARLVNWPSLRMNNERSTQDELPQMRKTHGGGRAQ